MEKCTWNRFSRCNDTHGRILGDEKERCGLSNQKYDNIATKNKGGMGHLTPVDIYVDKSTQ